MTIIEAQIEQLPDLIPLFDGYRIFYRQPSNFDKAKTFLKERLTNKESIIYLAYIEEYPAGFTQLYPIFSSVTMEPMYILNDLFVDSSYRNEGGGKALIDKAKDLCRAEKNKGLIIQTEIDNPAQNLYRREGFVKDSDLHFFWKNHHK
jgi:GNAT superfamily N-acetyltransferase